MADRVKPQGCTNLKLRQLSRVVTRHYDAFVAQTGLKNTQYSLLSHVVLLGPIRPSDLANRMHLDASTLTRNLQPLMAQGWLRQGPGDDARSSRSMHGWGVSAWRRCTRCLTIASESSMPGRLMHQPLPDGA